MGEVEPPTVMPEVLAAAVHRLLARTPCRLVAAQLDDLAGAVEQANLPGTMAEHPNWRRKLPVMLEQLTDFPLFRSVTEANAAIGTVASRTRRLSACHTASKPLDSAYRANAIPSRMGWASCR